ncbi:MAG: phosphomannomutase/phosphoglucomutase [Candidatus Marinimicrobia bacterium]|nr:phosphomannomutase/phosphoglucomutase [Candidatus Neomarinimicrobiota bacterium]
MQVNPYMFREYDIRGKVADDFPPEVVVALGKGFATYAKRLGANEIALSGDVRTSTPRLLENFKEGVLSTGMDIIYLGILPTPVNYYSMFKLNATAAVQITGSHNPPEFNGFKLSLFKKAVFGDMIQSVKTLIENEDYEIGEGDEARYDLKKEYAVMLKEKITFHRPVKVVMDCGNAAGAINAPEIFKMLGADLTELFCDVDGTFPNHHPDPTVAENLKDLIGLMKTGNYDVGIAFDGDADRVGVVDETGDIIWADQLMALFLPGIIEPGDEILYDVKCSKALEDVILRLGGKPIMWKTGHSLIKQKMSEVNCKLGGEMSGHIFFADDYFGYDDATYVAARLVELLSKTDKKLSELKAEIPKYYSTPEMRMAAENDEEKFRITKEAVTYFTENYDCNTVDGVRINFSDGWGLVRSSNTQPVIVCRFEASSPEKMEEYKELVLDKLQSIGHLEIEAGH